jgi:hypothetical protein
VESWMLKQVQHDVAGPRPHRAGRPIPSPHRNSA